MDTSQTVAWTRGYAPIQLLLVSCHASDFSIKYKRSVKGVNIFSVKEQILNIWGFRGHVVSVSVIRFCHSSIKAAIEKI